VSTIRIKVIYQKTKIILICLWYRTAYTTVKTDNVGRFNYCKGELYIFAFFIYSDKVYVTEFLLTVLASNRFDELFWKYMISIFVVIIMFALENQLVIHLWSFCYFCINDFYSSTTCLSNNELAIWVNRFSYFLCLWQRSSTWVNNTNKSCLCCLEQR